MASVRIQRSIRIKRLLMDIGSHVPHSFIAHREKNIQLALDEIDKDLNDAFELGRQYAHQNVPTEKS